MKQWTGAGKGRLALETADYATRSDFRYLVGRCNEGTTGWNDFRHDWDRSQPDLAYVGLRYFRPVLIFRTVSRTAMAGSESLFSLT